MSLIFLAQTLNLHIIFFVREKSRNIKTIVLFYKSDPLRHGCWAGHPTSSDPSSQSSSPSHLHCGCMQRLFEHLNSSWAQGALHSASSDPSSQSEWPSHSQDSGRQAAELPHLHSSCSSKQVIQSIVQYTFEEAQ